LVLPDASAAGAASETLAASSTTDAIQPWMASSASEMTLSLASVFTLHSPLNRGPTES
jgi:hypothetical protein